MIFFTSDLHLCHDRDFVYGPRGFNNVETHDKTIVERWNSVVSENDEVYLLGDVMLNNLEHGMEYFNQLNGYIYIILGNHDTARRQVSYMTRPKTSLLGPAYILRHEKYRLYLCHYPTLIGNFDWTDKRFVNLYGHTHQQDNFMYNIPSMYHVGCDSHSCTPVPINQVIEDVRRKYEENYLLGIDLNATLDCLRKQANH